MVFAGGDACFRARFQRQVTFPKCDADFLQEGIGRKAAGKNPDIVILNFEQFTGDVENDRVLFDLDGIRVENYLDLPVKEDLRIRPSLMPPG